MKEHTYVLEDRKKKNRVYRRNWKLLDNGNEVKSFISICAHMFSSNEELETERSF